MILTDTLCDRLCAAAREKSRELGVDISFAVCDENGLPRVYRRYGEALVLSITLVPGKAYTAAVTQLQNQGRGRGGCRGGVPDGHSGQRSQDHPGGGGISPVLPGKDCRRHRRGRGERRSRTAPSRSMWPPSLKS